MLVIRLISDIKVVNLLLTTFLYYISFSIIVNSHFVAASLLYLYLYKEDNAFISHINRKIKKCQGKYFENDRDYLRF